VSLVQLPYPFPVQTPLGEGLVLYVRDNGPMANDTWLVALDDGRFLHFLNSDCTSVGNATFGIQAPRREGLAEVPGSAVAAAAQKLSSTR
jgi:hypothetical protein